MEIAGASHAARVGASSSSWQNRSACEYARHSGARLMRIRGPTPGTLPAPHTSMARNTGKNPRSYDDIVRSTVVDPDSSVRPTKEQEQQAREGFRATDAEEQALHARVMTAIAATGPDAAGVTAEITGDLVRLSGQVPNSAMLRTLEDAVARVDGVETIHNQVVVGSDR
jgi:hypothetical protein